MTDEAEELLERQRNLDAAKPDMLIDFLKSGLDWDTACTAADVTQEMAEHLLEDHDFQARLKYHLAKKEAELLSRLAEASAKAAERGDSKGIERMLEILRPERYGKHATLAITPTKEASDKGIKIEFVGTHKKAEVQIPDGFGDELDDDAITED